MFKNSCDFLVRPISSDEIGCRSGVLDLMKFGIACEKKRVYRLINMCTICTLRVFMEDLISKLDRLR